MASEEYLAAQRKIGARTGPTTQSVTAEAIAQRALTLRQQGLSYDEIASAMRITADQAGRLVRKQLKKLRAANKELAQEVVDLELSRLDMMFTAALLHLRSGDLTAIDRMLKIQDRRAKYLGLDAAIKIQAEGATGGGQQMDLSSLSMEELEAMEQLLSKAAPTGQTARDDSDEHLEEILAGVEIDIASEPVSSILVGDAQNGPGSPQNSHGPALIIVDREPQAEPDTKQVQLANLTPPSLEVVHDESGQAAYASFGGTPDDD